MLAKDITGMRSGKLVAIEPTKLRSGNKVIWKCLCDCGQRCNVNISNLSNGHTKSCGCKNTRKDIKGLRFGSLVAVSPTKKRRSRAVVWECRCDCGAIKEVSIGDLSNGHTESCGCKRSRKDITGLRFGRLVAISPTSLRHRGVVWDCRCDCGGHAIVPCSDLMFGATNSCGCLLDAGLFARNTHIDPKDVPFEITNLIRARRVLKKAMAV